MAIHSLEDIASFVRDLGSACSAILMKDNLLFAGSHEGVLICWNNDGDELWRTEVMGPISDIALDESLVLVTASAKIHAFNSDEGNLSWSYELEGASDFVVAKEGQIWASSSVYELEVSDFIESTIWNFNQNGDVVGKWIIDERPWILGLHNEGGIVLGLGRPRCGYLRIRSGEEPVHKTLDTDSPVTCGFCESPTKFVLGHANGTISIVNDGKNSTYSSDDDSLITAVSTSREGWIAGNENGVIRAYSRVVIRPGSIDTITECSGYAWISSWDGINSTLFQCNQKGEELEISHNSRLLQSCHSNEKMLLGDSLGRVFMIENQVVKRRVKQVAQNTDKQTRNSELRARLRMLRNQ